MSPCELALHVHRVASVHGHPPVALRSAGLFAEWLGRLLKDDAAGGTTLVEKESKLAKVSKPEAMHLLAELCCQLGPRRRSIYRAA